MENNIYRKIEKFVEKGDISRDETHIDFINGKVVTWCLDDESLPTHTTSVYVRRINDVRQILRLKRRVKEQYETIKRLEAGGKTT